MSRSLRLVLSVFFVSTLGLAFAFGRQGQEKEVTIATRAVAGKVSMLTGQGGNIGVSVGDDGVLLVDDEFERLAPKIEEALGKLKPGPPRFLINTHHHGDHTDGNKHFGKIATVLAQENVRARMLDDKAPAQALPIVTFADGIALHFNGEEIRVRHVPQCHTDGDSVVWFTGSNVIHMGDLYFQLGYPYVDVKGGGSVVGLIEGLKKVLAELPADVKVIPGHGEVTGKKGLEEYLAMIETITQRVREHLARGEDAAAMVAAGITRDFDERWGHFDFVPPKNFVQSVVDSLH